MNRLPATPRRTSAQPAPDVVIAATRRWIEKAVIGLNLCPFAAPVYRSDLLRIAVTDATGEEALLDALAAELHDLYGADPQEIESTVLIHPHVLTDFADYNAFIAVSDMLVEQLGMRGEIQIASFHPAYRFAGTGPDDVSNCTNRSPYPMLHMLRERSISDGLRRIPDALQIAERNIATMRRLGMAGWQRLWQK